MERTFIAAPALLVLLSLGVTDAARAQTPAEPLLVAPPGADRFVVVSEAGKHGDEWRWTLPDGRVAYRQSFGLRGQVFERDQVVGYDAEGKPVSVAIRGITPRGDAAETLTIGNGVARWKSPVDEGEASAGRAIYLPYGGTFLAEVETLLAPLRKAGANGVDLLPSGHATLTPASRTLNVAGPSGAQTIHLWFLNGLGQSPQPVWLDGDGALFGSVGNLGVLPAGYEDALKPMIAAQDAAIAQFAPAIARRLLTDEARQPVLFRNVKLYDADRLRFVENQNVLVANGKIASIGAHAPELPAGTRVIDGTGKTLVPGLWDSHLHIGNDFKALSEVAIGVTSIRSPGSTIDYAVSARERRQAGTLVAPEAFTAAIIDRKGPQAAQGFPAVESLDETLAEVRKIKAAGLFGVKFYTSMQPEWIAPAAKLAHELGLHVSGHIPAGMRTLDAVNAGYDEITHIYFATMQAMPDDVVAKSNTTLRLTGPGRYFKDVAFDAEPLKSTIGTLAEKRIAVDPTLVVLERVLLAEAGTMGASYAPYAGTVPPAMERGYFKSGGIPLPEGTTRDDAQASFKHMVEYVNVLRKAGVPIVAGTDGWGIELVRELELYVQGGMTPAQALSTATIAAARNVGVEARTGSIAVGKEADLLLVDGDVESTIGNLRQVVAVVLDGALLDGEALRKEAGFSGKPLSCVNACAIDILKASVAFRTLATNGEVPRYAAYLRDVLVAGGFAPEDVKIEPFIDGGVDTATLTARWPGRDAKKKPIVLISHMDVVDARREDWERDPFTAVVADGYLFGRGSSDNKFGIATQVAALLQLKAAGWKPGRDVILAFSGDEETLGATAKRLAAGLQHAEYVLNSDAGGGDLAEDGSGPTGYYIQAGEKTYVDFTLTVTDPGGHSSRPTASNAIYRLSRALARIEPWRFPVQQSELAIASLKAAAPRTPGPAGEAMRRFLADPTDQQAIDALSSYPEFVGQLRTTCVATQLAAGHAPNALPQRATANVNCRVFPGEKVADVKRTLDEVIGDPSVQVAYEVEKVDEAPASPLRADVMQAVTKAVHARFAGLEVVPSMSAGATDGTYYRALGVPVYGVGGGFSKLSDDYAHGLNERIPVDAIEPAVAHWVSLLKDLAK